MATVSSRPSVDSHLNTRMIVSAVDISTRSHQDSANSPRQRESKQSTFA
jgi:hypothetical protein